MKTYKAIVRSKETGRYESVTSSYATKSDFVRDLRRNGYVVNPAKVKTERELDRIMDNTNANIWNYQRRK